MSAKETLGDRPPEVWEALGVRLTVSGGVGVDVGESVGVEIKAVRGLHKVIIIKCPLVPQPMPHPG